MDRTLVGDLQQLGAHAGVEIALKRDRPLDAIEHAFLGLAGFAIGRVDLAVLQCNRDAAKRQRFAIGVKAQSHRRAGAERREQIPVGIRTAVEPASGNRLIGNQPIATSCWSTPRAFSVTTTVLASVEIAASAIDWTCTA